MNRLFNQKPIIYLFIGWLVSIPSGFFGEIMDYFLLAISLFFIVYAFIAYFKKDY